MSGPKTPAENHPSKEPPTAAFCRSRLSEYLELLDWTGKQARQDKRGQIPADLAPILERLHIASDRWIDTVLNFGRFHRTAGREPSLAAEAARRGKKWLAGTTHGRAAFA